MKKRAEQNTIHNGDCRDFLPKLDSGSVRLIHTSPPYNIGRSYNAYADSRPLREYEEFLQSVVAECYRTLVPGGSLFWQSGYTSESETSDYIYPLDHLTFQLFLDCGFRLKDRIIWRYFGGMAFKRKFTNKHETILWWVKPGAGTHFDIFPVREKSKEYDARNNLFGRNPGNVWEVDRVAYGSTEQTSHVAVFPEEISERIVLSASQEGDLCLDPFSGSGTLCKVARSRGRKYLGFEIDQSYVEESRIRLGYCQPGEFDNVLSQVIKDHVFAGSRITLDLDAVCDRLDALLSRSSAPGLRTILTDDEAESIASFREDSISKPRKATIWRSLDSYLESEYRNDPIRLVDSSYLSAFRLNRVYNSVMRIALAWRWYNEFSRIPAKDLSARIEGLSKEEFSSFKLRGSKLSLRSYERDIRNSDVGPESKKRSKLDLALDLQ